MQRILISFTILLLTAVPVVFPSSLGAQSDWNNFELLKLKSEYAADLQTLTKITTDPVKHRELHILARSLNISPKGNSEQSVAVNLYNLLAAYYESVSDYPAALNALDKARRINNSQFPEKEVNSCNYTGYVFWHQSQYDSALYYHEKALEISRENGISTSAHAFTYLMLGNDYFDTGDYVKTSENYFESLKRYEKLKDTAGLIMAHNRLSKMYYKLKDHKRARFHLSLSQDLNKKFTYQRETAFSFNSLGNIHIEKNSLDSALLCFTETFRLYRATGDVIGQSIASINLGDTYYAVFAKTKRRLFSDSSYFYYSRSLELNRRVDNKFGMIYGWWGMADNLLKRSQPDAALTFYREALQTSKAINARSEEANLYWKMYHIFEPANSDSAYLYLKKYIEAKTLIENEERTKDLLRQESKYQIEKRVAEETIKMEQQNLLNTEKIKWKNYALTGVVLISLVLVYLVMIAIKRMKIIAHKNELINSINQALSSQHKEITDSINYARHIQNAILPSGKEFRKYFPESFILYKPKNIVAGDFYWLEKQQDTILFAAADCTGHGVPGAMVSVICNNGLNRSVREYGLTDPGKILDKTREIVIQEFEKSDEEVKDGMDISLLALSQVKNENKSEESLSQPVLSLSWAGANNPLWIIRPVMAKEEQPMQAQEIRAEQPGGDQDTVKALPATETDSISQTELTGAMINSKAKTLYTIIELKPDKQPIGKHTESRLFTTHTILLQPGDTIYTFTDGYADQFGGEKGKKYKASNFKNLLLSVQHESMERQKEIINKVFENWRGNLEQVDDVCVIGIRI